MEAKLFEVRDRGTFIPVLAVLLLPTVPQPVTATQTMGFAQYLEKERYLLARCGFRTVRMVQLTHLQSMKTHHEDWEWEQDGTRTMGAAHRHILRAWDMLKTGDVIDVEYLAGESKTAKVSEREDEIERVIAPRTDFYGNPK